MTRKWIARLIGATLVAAASTVATGAEAANHPRVAAHRGGALLMPENTFPAFDNAVRLGVDQLEFDVEMTKDGKLIVTHDSSVNPTFCTPDPGSGVKAGPVRELTLAQLEKFDCGSKHRADYPTQKAVPGTRMPTLDSFLQRYKNAPVEFYGETKMPDADGGVVDPVEFSRMMNAAIQKYGLESRFILQSKDWRTIDAMHKINPRLRTCLYGFHGKVDLLALAREHHAGCLLVPPQFGDAAEVKRLQDAGITVYSDVVDNEQAWRENIARGVDVLITNDPEGLIAYLKRRNAAAN